MLAAFKQCPPALLPALRFRTGSFASITKYSHVTSRTFAAEAPSHPQVPPPQRPRLVRRAIKIARFSGYFLLSSAFGMLAIGTGVFIHDAFTYTERHIDRVPVSPLALHPERGGPTNLPIARVQVDDEEDEENVKLAEKPRLVVVGGGWGVRRCSFHSFFGIGSFLELGY
jgi:hypothetical protein